MIAVHPAFAIVFVPFALQPQLALPIARSPAPAATAAPTPAPTPMPLAPHSLKGMSAPKLQLAKQDWRGGDRQWPDEPTSAPPGPAVEPPVVVIAPPAPLPAPPADQDIPDRDVETRKLSQGGFEFALGALAYRPDLSRVHFSGSGVPIDGIRGRQAFDHKGSELGMQRPVLLGGASAKNGSTCSSNACRSKGSIRRTIHGTSICGGTARCRTPVSDSGWSGSCSSSPA